MDLAGRWLRRSAGRWRCTPTGTASSSRRTRAAPCPTRRRSSGGPAELGIELIRAHSPQAKGRVERSFGTAQDRWVEAAPGGRDDAGGGQRRAERLLPTHDRRFVEPPPRRPTDGRWVRVTTWRRS